MDDMARSLGLDVEQVKEANFYKKGDISYLVSNSCTRARWLLVAELLSSLVYPWFSQGNAINLLQHWRVVES